MSTAPPQPGMLARVRNRLAMVRAVSEAQDAENRVSRLVEVEYLDQNLPVEDQLLWELEPDATAIAPRGLPDVSLPPMPARDFEAMRRAARWSALLPYRPVKAGPRPVIAPLMGAVQVEDYQLVPLAKALDMPRVQLGLFDDVGLGKTIEAGLLIAELIRRRRIRRVLVLCPAWLRKQWRDELQSKFGLAFDIIDRQETQALRRNMGMDANPWRTYPRAIASYHFLRQPDVLQQFEAASRTDPRSPLLPWDLLIVDEAHNAMPAAHGSDSDLCHVLQRISRFFEHRVFLSATPHNGFTRSYTGLLEMLDPVRITRSDKLTAAARDRASKIVVRRLKDEINTQDETEGREPRFVQRKVGPPIELEFAPVEMAVIEAADRFRAAFKRAVAQQDPGTRTAGNFVLETLAKRLLSCPYTFADSWRRFRAGLLGEEAADVNEVGTAVRHAGEEIDDDAETESRIALATQLAGMWARSLPLQGAVDEVDRALANLGLDPALDGPLPDPIEDTRFDELMNLISERLGPAGGWNSGERLIVFSEYRTTTDYLMRRLVEAFPREPDMRLLTLYGGMPERLREDIKEAFNNPAHDVRVLVATDAAGEGGNLQQAARLLLHYDLPWNPSRIDQRNGRLDRHGQARDVEVFHFSSEQDADLRFMSRLVGKIEVRRADLGAVGKLFQAAFHRRFIEREDDQMTLDGLDERLEATKAAVRADIPRNTELGREFREEFDAFVQQIDLSPCALRDTMEVALGSGVGGYAFGEPDERGRQRLKPPIPPAYRDAIDAHLRLQGEALAALQFDPADQLVEESGRTVFRPPTNAVLMHLGHPVVSRALGTLARARFPGTPESAHATRWLVTTGEVEGGADAEIRVTIEEMALNELRELVHHWVRVLRFPVKGRSIGDPIPELVPGGLGVPTPTLEDRARDLWSAAQGDLADQLRYMSKDLSQSIAKHMGQDLRKALSEQQSLFRERDAEITQQLSREIGALQRDLEELRASAAAGLFDVEELQSLDRRGNIEAEMAARRSHFEPLLAFLRREDERLRTISIPMRFAMRGDAQVFPFAIEIRFPEAGR